MKESAGYCVYLVAKNLTLFVCFQSAERVNEAQTEIMARKLSMA